MHSDITMNFPVLSALQTLVIEVVGSERVTGRELRRRLAEHNVRKTGPAFYQAMARMEEAGIVSGEYEQKIVDGQIIRERVYRVTGDGAQAFNDTLAFYQRFNLVRNLPAYG